MIVYLERDILSTYNNKLQQKPHNHRWQSEKGAKIKKPKIIHIHVSVAPDMFHNTVEDLKLFEELTINQAKADLQDEVILQDLGFKGKPDLSKLKVEYPIPIELQENRRVECRIPISVPYLNDID